MTLHHQDGTFLGGDNYPLYYQTWQAPEALTSLMIMIHGLGAHSGSYNNLVQHLAPKGIAIYSFDLRGHGRSPGQRGYIKQWAEFRQDLNHFLEFIRDRHSNLHYFLWGHSLGAVIALDYAIRHPQNLQGVIASAVPLGEVSIAPYKKVLARLLSKIWPRFSLSSGIQAATLSRDTQYLVYRQSDPLRHRQGTARLTTEFFQATTWLNNHADRLQVPLLMLHGGQDKIADLQGSQSFYQQVTWPDKAYIEYPDAYHDLHADLGFRDMLRDLEQWLNFKTNA